ncbi:chemotaxis protein CheV [Hydrogenimonas thermophila]|uniref:Two-component system, chemotaxis family, response regulator CheV n=1 Tax=Hydrogenimonas thermophila TaxID=223786 RepID=A0A1I5PHN4_9BACT|nr:chemotaxis protein CheW [Hydrogenimonas thermophila]WOE70739.1 response regulator [Hydrogenimonas thermophila]WOE73256.1 response regulator [Hydrogenimonas thermophila]SFP33006.1 two-component system, chemotaxis family, response regulator CheV [Hydrogenimonas thermophila]
MIDRSNISKHDDKTLNKYEVDDELIRLVTSNADITSQYVIFQNGKDEYYAINVAKVEELVVYKDLFKVDTSDPDGLIEGTAKIRDEMMNIVNFDNWLGLEKLAKDEYELAIVCNYAGAKVAMVIKSVYGVINIEPSQMFDDSIKDEKVSYITDLKINGKEVLCKVFNSDLFIRDILPKIFEDQDEILAKSLVLQNIEKKVLIAEDSNLIQKMIEKLLNNMQIEYEAYANGKLLFEALQHCDIDKIGLILTDIEMPVMGGMELIRKCKSDEKLQNIPIVVNTNMANKAIIQSCEKLGAKEVLEKLDLEAIKKVILKYARD